MAVGVGVLWTTCVFWAVGSPGAVYATSSDLDVYFDGDGLVTLNASRFADDADNSDYDWQIAVVPDVLSLIGVDGEVVYAAGTNASGQLVVEQYQGDGSIDPAFGLADGVGFFTDVPVADFTVVDALPAPDGGVVVVLQAAESALAFKLSAAGVPDATFGTDGFVEFAGHPSADPDDPTYEFALDGLPVVVDDGVVVAATTSVQPGANPFVRDYWHELIKVPFDSTSGVVLDSDNRKDLSFSGRVVGADDDGRLYVADNDFFDVSRYSAAGVVDSGFAVTVEYWAAPIGVRPDGTVLVADATVDENPSTPIYLTVERFSPVTGASEGVTATLAQSPPHESYSVTDLVMSPNGAAYVIGLEESVTSGELVTVRRVGSNGMFDRTYAGDGVAEYVDESGLLEWQFSAGYQLDFGIVVTADPGPDPVDARIGRFVRTTGNPLAVSADSLTGHPPGGATAADPVLTATGNLTGAWTDLAEPVFGMSLTRSYNGLSSLSSPMGDRWSLATGPSLVAGIDAVDVVMPDGTRYTFDEDGVGGYAAADGVAGMLSVDSATPVGGGPMPMLRVDYANGAVDRFDTLGRLWSQSWWDGQSVSLAYGADGVSSVTSSSGLSFTFTYSAGHPVEVVSSSGRSVSYGYDGADQLVSVVDEFDGETTITYTAEGWLATMTDPSGVVLEDNTYDDAGRVTEQVLPSGVKMVFGYELDAGRTTVEAYALELGDWVLRSTVDYVHDELGRVIAILDPFGNTVEQSYDASGNLIAATSRSGIESAAEFDADYNLTSITRPGYGETTYVYDGSNRVVSETDPYGETTSYTYDGTERLPSTVTDTLSHTTTYDVVDGLIMSVTDPDGVVTSYTYDSARHVTSMTDGEGNETEYTYDTTGRLSTTTSPTGKVTTNTYDAAGRLASTTAPGGAVTSYTYDDAGRVLTVTDPTNAVTMYEYNAAGLLASTTAPGGAETVYEYDGRGHRTATVAPGGVRTETDYDELARPVWSTTALGDAVLTDFDTEGRPLARTVDSTGAVSTTEYDANGLIVATEDPLERRHETSYDAHGRVTDTTAPGGAVTAYTYDDLGRQTTVTDPRGGVTTTTYTPGGRVATVTDPTSGVTTYTYDDAGRLTETERPGGRVTAYTYNADSQPITETSPGGLVTEYTYDTAGRVSQIIDGAGIKTIYTYTARGEVETEKYGAQTAASWTYNPNGTVASVTDPKGNTTSYAYDGRGNVLTRTDALGGTDTWAYNDADQVLTATDPLNRTTTNTYNGAGQLTSTTDPTGRTATISYRLDNSPESAEFSDGTNTITADYTYDTAGRLTSIDENGTAVTYTYSTAGDLLSHTTPAGTVSFEYDTAGRRTLMRFEPPWV